MQEPDINKKQLGVLLPLDLFARVKRAAEDKGLTISELVTIALQREYGMVEISSDDLFWIAEQVKNNEIKRNRKRSILTNKKGQYK